MNEQKLTLSIRHYAYCIAVVILLVCGLTYLLSSCIVEDNPHPNRKLVPVDFILMLGSYGNDVPVEGRSMNISEPATDIVHVAGNVFIYATLEEEHPVTKRAPDPLNEGATVRVVAYKSSDLTYVHHGDYTVTGGNLYPIGGSGYGVTIPEGNTYCFVAYTFNDPATSFLPDHTGATPFDATALPNPDLLWGSTLPPHVNIPLNAVYGSIPPIEITLNHMFTRVKVVASTATITNPPVNIQAIDGAYVSPSYHNLKLDAANGRFEPVTPNSPENLMTRFLSWRAVGATAWGAPTGMDFSDVESDYYFLYSNLSDTVSLFINNLTVGNSPLGEYKFRFSNQTLLPGHSYILELNFRRQVWAGSNIFWDGSKLTFLPETTRAWEGQGYQGVYFMWGSLVGISPVGIFSNSTKLYVPPIVHASWTEHTITSSTKGWSSTAMIDIPRITGGSLVSKDFLDNHISRNYLYSEAHTPATFKGDICKYLTDINAAPPGKWRIPNAREFGVSTVEYSRSEFRNLLPLTGFAAREDGKFDLFNDLPALQRSYIVKNASNTYFPDGLSRDNTGTVMIETRYLSGSPTSWTSNKNDLNACFNMVVSGTGGSNFSFTDAVQLGYQGIVRCLKLDTENRPTDVIVPAVDLEEWVNGGIFGGKTGDTAWQGEVWY